MDRILIGTSGYSYDDWVGPVYPPGTRKSDYLEYYARRFRLTELNFTYYRLPTADGLRSIARKTPDDFRFTVKAHRSITHDRGPEWHRETELFAQAVSALRSVPFERPAVGGGHVDRLAGVLLQFPFSFHYDEENRRYLASVTSTLRPLRLFVEFRNDEWDQASVWREMERRELALVIPDMPRLKGLPRVEPRLTAPWGYVRFHGRNDASWWNGTNVTRYDYLYREEELRAWVEPVRAMVRDAEAVVVTFNNHFAGQAVRNAEEFAAMIGSAA
ncbi:MAG: DUF72 domain-containing protein [Spirochaetota bacterium]